MVEQIQGLLFSNETGTKMRKKHFILINQICLLYTSDAADEL